MHRESAASYGLTELSVSVLVGSCGVRSREELDLLVGQQTGSPDSRPVFSAMARLIDAEVR